MKTKTVLIAGVMLVLAGAIVVDCGIKMTGFTSIVLGALAIIVAPIVGDYTKD